MTQIPQIRTDRNPRKHRSVVTAYAVVLSIDLDTLRLCHTPPLAPLPACGEGTGVGSTQQRRCQRKTR